MYREDFERGFSQERNTEDVYSKPVRAGKRTYFFDVKSTRDNKDFYLTITESKRRQERDGNFVFAGCNRLHPGELSERLS